jgi:hypothetical protein
MLCGMKAQLSLAVCMALTCHVTVAADEPTGDARWLQDANGCKFLNWAPLEPREITWTGQCVDGYVSGPGQVRLGRRATFRGEFAQGRIVRGTFEYDGGKSYQCDTFLDNQLHGDVIVRYPNDVIVKARYEHDKALAEGAEVTWPDGTRYRGQIDPRSLDLQGKGVLEWANGTVYEGEFKQGRVEGVGVQKLRDGEVRTGTFRDGTLEGHGTILYADQARYEGNLVMGKESGIGRLELPGGAWYEGEFVAGRYQGKGKMKYTDGIVYEGDFLAGDRHGNGTMLFPSGNRYEGQWISGKRHGTGRFTDSNGGMEEGEWQADKLSGKCHKVTRDSVYDGQCRDDLASGQGRLEDKAQSLLYEGEFLADRFDGRGSLRIRELAYEGMFKSGAMEGPGTLKVGKLTMTGDFKAGVLARGTIVGADGRTFEVDLAKNEILEVNKDGTKHPIDQLPPDISI